MSGWRTLDKPEEIRRRAGMDTNKLANLKQWLLDLDNRTFPAVVIRHGYIVLEVHSLGRPFLSVGDESCRCSPAQRLFRNRFISGACSFSYSRRNSSSNNKSSKSFSRLLAGYPNKIAPLLPMNR